MKQDVLALYRQYETLEAFRAWRSTWLNDRAATLLIPREVRRAASQLATRTGTEEAFAARRRHALVYVRPSPPPTYSDVLVDDVMPPQSPINVQERKPVPLWSSCSLCAEFRVLFLERETVCVARLKAFEEIGQAIEDKEAITSELTVALEQVRAAMAKIDTTEEHNHIS